MIWKWFRTRWVDLNTKGYHTWVKEKYLPFRGWCR